MVLQSTRWLALGYFTYFFSYGIFLPFWSVWLKGIGLTPETIGLLLGAGLVARFLGSLLIAPRVSDPSRLISALRVLALLTLLFAVAFWAGAHVAWLMLVMIGFNLFFSPLVPLTDALANTWQKQFPLDYGKVRLWGSVAFVIGSAFSSVRRFSHKGQAASRRAPAGLRGWRWFARTGAFWPAFVYCRGHMRPITVLAPFTGRQLATRPRRWGICGRWAWWRKSLSLR